jgi:iron complex transport system substrate-binding protein
MRHLVVLAMLLVVSCAPRQPGAPDIPQRIISLAPSITETLFAVGAGDKVVGVTNYCNYPEDAKQLPKVGDSAVIDFEKVVSLKPDLVIATYDWSPREAVEKIESLGLRTLIVHTKNFTDMLDSIVAIGEAVGSEKEASALSSRLRSGWGEIQPTVTPASGPHVLLLYGVNPLVAAGKGSLGDELIRQAGGANVFGDSDKAYVTTDYEKVIALGPDVIVQVAMGSETNEEALENWARWTSIPAVREGRVFVLDPDLVTRPGPRIIEALDLLRRAVGSESGGR